MRSLRWLLLLALASGMAAACFRPQVQSARVDEAVPVPETLGLFPILSSIEVRHGYPHPPRYELYDDQIIVTPPADMTMAVTPESRMLSNAFSVALQQQGFGLKELPVEHLEGDATSDGGGVDRYGISLELLGRLRLEFGLEAIVVGDAYFLHRYNGASAPAIEVVAAHLRVIDTATLDVIAQVDMPYDASGAGINSVARELAAEMARMGTQVAAAEPAQRTYESAGPYPTRGSPTATD
jgi:hypothetical protein